MSGEGGAICLAAAVSVDAKDAILRVICRTCAWVCMCVMGMCIRLWCVCCARCVCFKKKRQKTKNRKKTKIYF